MRRQVFNIVERCCCSDSRSTSALEPTGKLHQKSARGERDSRRPAGCAPSAIPCFHPTGGCCMDSPISYQPCQLLFLIYDFMKAPICKPIITVRCKTPRIGSTMQLSIGASEMYWSMVCVIVLALTTDSLCGPSFSLDPSFIPNPNMYI